MKKFLPLIIASLAIAGCTSTSNQAPVEIRGPGYGQTRDGKGGNNAVTPVTPPIAAPQSSIEAAPLEPNDSYNAQGTAAPATAEATPATPPAAQLEWAKGDVQGGGKFGWPVKGSILSNYGKKPDGQMNDGINIAAPAGTTAYAGGDGTVAYAGSQLKSFGNMVLIKHEGGFFTVYAHLDQINVKKDQPIRRGQPVGTVGQSGGVSQPQLHFEVRKGSQPVDPNPYLSK